LADSDLRERIVHAAAMLICRDGFHGTSMRDIAGQAECSLPMMYYYFKNKDELYEEIAINRFFTLIGRMNAAHDFSLPPAELYTQVAMQRKNLNHYDKAIFKINYKLWLGFEGTPELRLKIIDWERNRVSDNRRILDKYVKNEEERQMFAEVFLGFLENMINKIVLFNDDISEDELKSELALLLSKVG
jgi:AcrR family transcriptional regulator